MDGNIIQLGLVAWALCVLFALILMRMAGDGVRAARAAQGSLVSHGDATIAAASGLVVALRRTRRSRPSGEVFVFGEYVDQPGRDNLRARCDLGQLPDYWLGYERGLIRGYRGKDFGTDLEHEIWLTLAIEGDASLRERGRGYRDGLVMATAEEAA